MFVSIYTSRNQHQVYMYFSYRDLAFGLPLSKLYTNSLVSSLNARKGWDLEETSSEGPHNELVSRQFMSLI